MSKSTRSLRTIVSNSPDHAACESAQKMTRRRDKAQGHWLKTGWRVVLGSSLPSGSESLDDRRVFRLDDAQWAALMKALDTPEDTSRLCRLLETKAPWELRSRGE